MRYLVVIAACIACILLVMYNAKRCKPGDPRGPTIGRMIHIEGCYN